MQRHISFSFFFCLLAVVVSLFSSCKEDELSKNYFPEIKTVSPITPVPGDEVTLTGDFFSIDVEAVKLVITDAAGKEITFQPTYVNDTILRFILPQEFLEGTYSILLYVYDNPGEVYDNFVVSPEGPIIIAIQPKEGKTNDSIIVIGRNLDKEGEKEVFLVNSSGEYKTTITYYSDTSFVFKIPPLDGGEYLVLLKIKEEMYSFPEAVNVMTPILVGTGEPLVIGEEYTILGDNFLQEGEETSVYLENEAGEVIPLEVVSVEDEKIVVLIPEDIILGAFELKVKVGDDEVTLDTKVETETDIPYLSHAVIKDHWVKPLTVQTEEITIEFVGANIPESGEGVEILFQGANKFSLENIAVSKDGIVSGTTRNANFVVGIYDIELKIAGEEQKSSAIIDVFDIQIYKFIPESTYKGGVIKAVCGSLPENIENLTFSSYHFDATQVVLPMEVTERVGDTLTFKVDKKITPDRNKVQIEVENSYYKKISGASFNVLNAEVSYIYPLKGVVGTEITIAGIDFFQEEGKSNALVFTHKTSGVKQELPVMYVSEFELKVLIPEEMNAPGEYEITLILADLEVLLENDYSTFTLLAPPKIERASKQKVHVGSSLVMYGTNFVYTSEGKIYFLDNTGTEYEQVISVLTKTKIESEVEKSIPIGKYSVVFRHLGGETTLPKDITTYEGRIDSISSERVIKEEIVTIYGEFADNYPDNIVSFRATDGTIIPIEVREASGDKLTVTIPNNIAFGEYVIVIEVEGFPIVKEPTIEVVPFEITNLDKQSLNIVTEKRDIVLDMSGQNYKAVLYNNIKIVHSITEEVYECVLKSITKEKVMVSIPYIPSGEYYFRGSRSDISTGVVVTENKGLFLSISKLQVVFQGSVIRADSVDDYSFEIDGFPQDENISFSYEFSSDAGAKSHISELPSGQGTSEGNIKVTVTGVNVNKLFDGILSLDIIARTYSIKSIATIEKNQRDIYTFAQFDAIRKDLKGGYSLMNDIEFPADIVSKNDGKGFIPIGKIDEESFNLGLLYNYSFPFEGVINGNNNTLSNVYIKDDTRNGVGVIGLLGKTARVENIIVRLNTTVPYGIDGGYRTAIFVGSSIGGEIRNCHVRGGGKIRGKGYFGGIVGITHGLVEFCSSDADVHMNNTPISDQEYSTYSDTYGFGGGIAGITTGFVRQVLMRGDVVEIPWGGGLVGLSGNSGVIDGQSGSLTEGEMSGNVIAISSDTEVRSTISFFDDTSFSSGIIGVNSGSFTVVKDCVFSGELENNASSAWQMNDTRTFSLRTVSHVMYNPYHSISRFQNVVISSVDRNSSGDTPTEPYNPSFIHDLEGSAERFTIFYDRGKINNMNSSLVNEPSKAWDGAFSEMGERGTTLGIFPETHLASEDDYREIFGYNSASAEGPDFDFDAVWEIPSTFGEMPTLRFITQLPPF